MELLGLYKIPTYAVTALEYGDYSGMEQEDIENLEEWLSLEKLGNVFFDWDNGINEEETNEVNEAYFTSNPAFGQAMDCIDCAIYQLPKQS